MPASSTSGVLGGAGGAKRGKGGGGRVPLLAEKKSFRVTRSMTSGRGSLNNQHSRLRIFIGLHLSIWHGWCPTDTLRRMKQGFRGSLADPRVVESRRGAPSAHN